MSTSKFKIHPFGKYMLLEEVASGGMAIVYKGLGKMLDGKNHYFAIKRILPNYANDEEFISLLKDEARLMVQLNHPNIVSLIEFGKVEDDYYISMEYIEGTTLKGMIQRVLTMKNTFTIDMAAHIVREIATGLSYAHRKTDENGKSLGIVHRDISPANILISYEGEVKITDFGISKASTQSHFTQSGIIRGKTGYMSPEQTRSDIEIDSRSDLFSLGVIFFELLSGKKLFYAKSIPESIRLVREGNVPPIGSFRSDVPKELERILLKILDLDPDKRFQRAEDLMDALNEFLAKYSPAGRPIRITHVDLIGFMRRFYPQEMAAGRISEEEALVSKSLSDAYEKSTVVDKSRIEKLKTFAHNPKFDISSPVEPVIAGEVTDKENRLFLSKSLFDASEGEVASFGKRTANEITEIDSKFDLKKWGKWIGGAVLALILTVAFMAYRGHVEKSYQMIQIRTEPSDARVSIDGVLQSQKTPAVYRVLKDKKNISIVVEKKGFITLKQTKRVSDLEAPMLFILEQDRSLIGMSKVLFNTEPAQVKVFIDGQEQGTTTPIEVELEVGKTYKLKFQKDGFDTKETVLTVDVPGTLEKTVRLTPAKKKTVAAIPQKVTPPAKLGKPGTTVVKPGSLSVTSNPWSYVSLDGKKIGETPVINFSTTAGIHRLKLYNPDLGMKEKEISIEIQSGKSLRCTYVADTGKAQCF